MDFSFYRDLNNLELVEGTYVLMRDVNRYNDEVYDTCAEAEEAMEEAQEEGCDKMWVGYVENTGDKENPHLDILFECGESA